MSWTRIREVVRKEFLVTLRDPKMRIFLFGPPLIQLIIFGFAVNLDVEDSRLGWLDRDRTPASRALSEEFEGSTYFRITHRLESDSQVEDLLGRGEVVAVATILPGFGRAVQRNRPAAVQLIVDGTDSNTAAIVSSYASRVAARYGARLLEERMGRLQMEKLPRLSVRSRVWFNENLRSQDYFVPGVIVNIVGLVTVMLTAMAVVREKEIGTLEQLMVTPIRPLELMLGKTLPFAAVGLLEMILVTSAALLIFGVPFRGRVLLLLASSLLFVLTTLGAGLLISTVSGTQQQAMMGSFFFFLPAFLLSGFAFPIRNMPEAVQWITYLNPMRYFLEIVRGLFLKGIGAGELWTQMIGLAAIGAISVTASVARFSKRID